MRLLVTLENPRGAAVPVNHQQYLTGVIYVSLARSSADFARFLHDRGYRLGAGPKAFKLFTFSGLRSRRRRIDGPLMHLDAGPVEWWIASPVPDFLTHCATGLLAAEALTIHRAVFPIASMETLPAPDFRRGRADFTCWTPIVASVSRPDGTARYLRPEDGSVFSEAVRANLLRKHQALHGVPPEDDRFRLEFAPDYLAAHRGGTKKITFKGIDVVGALAPFAAEGSPALLSLGYDCGFGEKNAAGFGMVETHYGCISLHG